MLKVATIATCLGLTSFLSGCGTTGYVESDIPGVAESLGAAAIRRNTAISCRSYGAAYARYSEATTSSDLIRRRVDYSFQC